MTKETTRTQASVQNGILILQTAIKNQSSLSEASRKNGKGRNYLSDVKARLQTNLVNKNISRATYREFRTLLKTYNKI